ncbi:MAG: rRNA methyltransferase [bacterium]|nr:rRNA methyltransferase [bacterium]
MLPASLLKKVEGLVKGFSSERLQEISGRLSALYKKGAAFEDQEDLAKVYAAARFPATYAALTEVFGLFKDWDIQPKTLLDLGGGPGTTFWAAKSFWDLEKVTVFESSKAMGRVAESLGIFEDAAPPISWQSARLENVDSFPKADMAVLSYVLGELPKKDQDHVLRRAFEAADQFVVLVGPGTPAGFEVLRRARSNLIEWGGSVWAPCPHDLECPMQGRDWCHFSVRLPRTNLHRTVKTGSLPYEDEKYAYVIVGKEPCPDRPKGRLVKRPMKRPGHVVLDVCQQSGDISRQIVSKKDKQSYTKARRSSWGDPWQ